MRIALAGVAPIAIGCLAMAGCGTEPVTIARNADPPIQAYVDGAAASALSRDGHFARSVLIEPDEEALIDAARAEILASAYVRTFGKYLKGTWESERGAPVDLSELRPARTYFASTPHGPLPSNVHPGIRNGLGPYFLVTMTEASVPTLVVAVAARGTGVTVDAAGLIVLPRFHGNDFWSEAIPLGVGAHFRPSSPEEAVATVGRLTGARTIAVPELFLRGFPFAPVAAMWRLTLDRRVAIGNVATGRSDSASVVFVGTDPGDPTQRPDSIQPVDQEIPVLTLDADSSVHGPFAARISIRGGHPVAFQSTQLRGAN